MHERHAAGSVNDDETPALLRSRAPWSFLVAAIGCILVPGVACAERWTFSASASASEYYNRNFGEGQPPDYWSTALTGTVGIHGEGARLKLNGTFSVTETIYGSNAYSNSFAPTVSAQATLEAIEKFFWVDATANVSQTYASPFGPQPANLVVPTANRYTSETYSVSPYIKGAIDSQTSYSVRDDNVWTSSSTYGGSSVSVPTTYWNNLNGQVNTVRGLWGLTLEYSGQYYNNGVNTDTYIVQVARAIASYQIDPQLDVSLRLGYESDRFPQATTFGGNQEGVIYGAGVHWRPTDRTDLNGYWEHRFFGSSYSWQLTHRLPNIALSANFTRGLTSYPQLALVIPSGVTVAQFLDLAFTTRIPDPAERAQAVAQFLAQSGLPPTLASPLNVYAQSLTLQNTANASAVWIGARNSLGFTVFRVESEAISGQGSALPPAFQFGQNYTETGAGVNYAHRLTTLTNFSASATYSRSIPNVTNGPFVGASSNNFNAGAALSTQFTPKTSASAGVSYFRFDTSGGASNSSTLSIYATISHTF